MEKKPALDLKVPRPIETTAPPPRPVEPVAPPAPSPVPVKESPKPAVQTNVFSNPAARGTVRRAPQEVQTGGFGSPAGIEPRAAAGGTDKVPQMGSGVRCLVFDIKPQESLDGFKGRIWVEDQDYTIARLNGVNGTLPGPFGPSSPGLIV